MVALFSCCVQANQAEYEQFAAAQKTKQHTITAPYQQEIAALLTNVKTKTPPSLKPAIANNPKANSAAKIIVFVSFAMPTESIKTWLHEAHKIGASVVIRGLINNSFTETVKAIAALIKEQQVSGIAIDPTLFTKFNITKVPAVVAVDASGNYDVIFGDVTLDYALTTIDKRGVATVQDALQQLRGSHA